MRYSMNGTMNLIAFRFIHVTRVCLKHFAVRKPIRVLNVPSTENHISSIQNVKRTTNKVSIAPQPAENAELEIIKKPLENVISYEQLKKTDARFVKMMGLVKSRNQREKNEKILLEGKRLINDAIHAGMQMNTLYFSRERDLMDIKLKDPKKVEICRVLYRTLTLWSGLTTCPGVMAVFRRPSPTEITVMSQPTIPVTILCDNIREPGNLGSIIRNAAAAGCKNILLTKGCVDPWGLKVLRTGCGGHFRIPIVNDIEWSQISNHIPSSASILIADNSPFVEEMTITSDIIDFDDGNPEKEQEEELKYVTLDENNQPMCIDESFDSENELEKYKDIQLPTQLYSRIKYPNKHIVLYVGGETHGIDPRIIKLVCEYSGKKIKIPMENGMESLNSAFALTIILYEIKRHFSQTYVK